MTMPARPADNANKQTWVNYLAAHGMTVEAARAMTKPQMLAWEPPVQKLDTTITDGDIAPEPTEHVTIVDAEIVEDLGDPAGTNFKSVDPPDNPNPSDPGVPVNSARGGFLNIQDAILEVMKTVGAVRKTQDHSAPGAHFKFRGVDQVVNAVQPAFLAVGVTISPKLLSRKQEFSVPIGGQQKPTSWAEVDMEYVLEARDGSKRSWIAPGAAMDSGDKALGKACSVAYRIAMLQGLCIPTDEPDPDAYVPDPQDQGEQGDGYVTHGRGQNVAQRQAQPQQGPDYTQAPAPTQADKIREYTMQVMEQFGMTGGHIREKFGTQFGGANWFAETDLERLKSFGAQIRDEAVQDRAAEEAAAVANVLNGLGGTVIETEDEPDASE